MSVEDLAVYLPMDRRHALARGATLPDLARGAALFADISGFTPLTEALVHDLGPQRGAEVLAHHLNLVYDALIAELHRYGGSVIGFSGDAITCWLDGDTGERATACALAMQRAMGRFAAVATPSGRTVTLAVKAAVATGPVRRFLVGDPEVQVIDVLAGTTLEHLAAAEHLAARGEVVLDPATVAALDGALRVAAWRDGAGDGRCFAVVEGLAGEVETAPGPATPGDTPGNLTEEQVRPWLLPAVYERLRAGQGEFLAELRPAVALFLQFGGIDYDGDPEAGARLDAYVRWVQRTLAEHTGTLIQLTIGDKGSYLYAAFGAPVAHEDDAVRAAAAALALRMTPATLDFVGEVRIGIGQGRMRTGAYGASTQRTYGVLGDGVNLAARLMQAAAPGQILASQAVRAAAGDAFAWEDLPPLRVKGKSEPVAVFALHSPAERRTIRLQEPRYRLPMVGREAELELIARQLELALAGQGQVVAVTGEAGLGKSRLVAEVIRLADCSGLGSHGGECPSYGTNTSYLVWRSIWRGLLGVDPEAPPEFQVTAVAERVAALDPALLPRLPLLGPVLNLPIPDNDLTASLDAKLRKTSLEALLVDCLRGLARATPLLLVLEDCHWLDPLSHDLLEEIGRAIAALPVLVVLSYRPLQLERLQAPRVSQLPHFTEVPLTDFTPEEAARLIRLKLRQLYGERAEMSERLAERITARAQGNPFYIEELLNYLRDQELDPNDGRAVAGLDLPASLHSLILTRIDRLGQSQKLTLKLASVIGRVFRAAMLWGAYPVLGGAQRVLTDLGVLRRLDLTPLDTPEPELTYLFKHIVTQEVAYESLPYATRAILHDRVAQFIERSLEEGAPPPLDLLAYHYGRSDNTGKQREYLLKAGEAAQAAYANDAAIDYYRRALPLLPAGEQVAAQLKLAQVFEVVGHWDEAAALYRQALAQAEELGDPSAQAHCQMATGELLRKRGAYDEASSWLTRARAGFEAVGDEAGVGQALHYAGSLAAQRGDYATARTLYGESLAIRRRLGDEPNTAALLSNLGILARYAGDYAAARRLHEEGLAIRRKLGDRRAIAVSLNNLGNVATDQGDDAEARARLEEAVRLQREVGDRFYLANALNNLANVARAQGDYAAACALYHESLTINRGLGDKWALAYLLEDIGCLHALEGRATAALRLVGAASAVRDAIGAPRSSAEQAKLEQALAPARQSLGEATQTVALAEGMTLPLQQAIDDALGSL